MSSTNVHLFQVKGWQAVVLLVVVIGLLGYRFVSFKDLTENEVFMRELHSRLFMEYFPRETAKVLERVKAGEADASAKVDVLYHQTQPVIESIEASFPLFGLYTEQDVVVKVDYRIEVGDELREPRRLYLLYQHSSLGNTWHYRFETTPRRYYLNFL